MPWGSEGSTGELPVSPWGVPLKTPVAGSLAVRNRVKLRLRKREKKDWMVSRPCIPPTARRLRGEKGRPQSPVADVDPARLVGLNLNSHFGSDQTFQYLYRVLQRPLTLPPDLLRPLPLPPPSPLVFFWYKTSPSHANPRVDTPVCGPGRE